MSTEDLSLPEGKTGVADATILRVGSQKLSVLEKIGYSLGDLAANLIFQTLMAFLAFFYTDIYKIPAGKASVRIAIKLKLGALIRTRMA